MPDPTPDNTEFGPNLPGRDPGGKFKKGEYQGGPGRPKGKPNQITRVLKDLIMGSMERRGRKILEAVEKKEYGTEACQAAYMDSLPNALFMELLKRLVPVKSEVEVDPGEGLQKLIILKFGDKIAGEEVPEEPEKEEES